MPEPGPAGGLLTGEELRSAFHAAGLHLRDRAKAIDAINVYPVPDGDTGSNMAATMQEATDTAGLMGGPLTAGGVLATLARGALYGARGNSGVILSQALRGLAAAAGETAVIDAAGLAKAFDAAADAAYAAVAKPVEGTMLTVLRAAAIAARSAVAAMSSGGSGEPCLALLREVIRAAEVAEAETINQLPALTEAGVPDAGGEGVCTLLRGLLAALEGSLPASAPLPARAIASLSGHAVQDFGFCTEFLLEAAGPVLDVEQVKASAAADGNSSVIVVGDETLLRVHVHSSRPQALLDAAANLGRLSRVKLEDMSAQHVRARATGSGARAAVGLLALSRGPGFDAVFQSLGATVMDLGDIVKPPVGEITRAADAMGLPDVFVLPNHKNVVLAAEQARSLCRCTLHLVSTTSLPQGVAAAMAFSPGEPLTQIREAMERATAEIVTVEVTIAAANRTADGVTVHEGDCIAFVDGRLVGAAENLTAALLAGLETASAQGASLVTIYAGSAIDGPELDGIRSLVARRFPDASVEALEGGQALYPLIASVER